ncbi:MAG: hypothetical protein IJ341_01220 [Bacteroidales bacterium]|nr:hypothetical protein [Bacteroidales bacterium]
MIVITTIFWIIVGVMVLYLTIFVIAFIYNGYLLATGKMSREELANKVAYNKYIKEKKLKKKPKKRYASSLPPPF